MTSLSRRVAVGLLSLAIAGGVAACGGGSSTSSTATTSQAPGANVDPNANGTYTGPINRAKTAVTNLNNQQQQVDQQSGSGTP